MGVTSISELFGPELSKLPLDGCIFIATREVRLDVTCIEWLTELAIGLRVEKCTIVDARIRKGVFFVNSSFFDQQPQGFARSAEKNKACLEVSGALISAYF